MLKAVIIDDEEAARNILFSYVQKYCEGVEVVGFGESVKTGLEAIKKHQPHIVFLDVEMPFGNAFDLLEQIDKVDFETVFVTAYSEYAIRALNLSAAYYLLKPIDIDELVQAVDKIKANQQSSASTTTQVLIDNIKTANKQLHKIILPTMEGFEVVQVKDILRCEASDNFTTFHIAGSTPLLICRTLKHYEELLQDFGFVRVHRSHLINIDYVSKYTKGKGGYVTLSDGSTVDVSPARKEAFLSCFMG